MERTGPQRYLSPPCSAARRGPMLRVVLIDTDRVTDQLQEQPISLDHNGCFDLADLVHLLKKQGVPITGRMLSYYSFQEQCFIFCGTDPLSPGHMVNYIALTNRVLLLKHQNNQRHHREQEPGQCQRQKKKRDRTIVEVLSKVEHWRRLHEQGGRLSLEEASRSVGIQAKSLHDYLHIIKQGHRFHFDFKGHAADRFGVLRQFVKQK